MKHPLLPVLLLAATPALVSAEPPFADSVDGVELAQLTIRERIIIRVPRMAMAPPGAEASMRSMPAPQAPPRVEWVERGAAPRCLAATDIAGATVSREGQIDFVTSGGRRVRARLQDDCPALDFYSGLYLKPGADGNICARRDVIRARSGTRCAVTGFVAIGARR